MAEEEKKVATKKASSTKAAPKKEAAPKEVKEEVKEAPKAEKKVSKKTGTLNSFLPMVTSSMVIIHYQNQKIDIGTIYV